MLPARPPLLGGNIRQVPDDLPPPPPPPVLGSPNAVLPKISSVSIPLRAFSASQDNIHISLESLVVADEDLPPPPPPLYGSASLVQYALLRSSQPNLATPPVSSMQTPIFPAAITKPPSTEVDFLPPPPIMTTQINFQSVWSLNSALSSSTATLAGNVAPLTPLATPTTPRSHARHNSSSSIASGASLVSGNDSGYGDQSADDDAVSHGSTQERKQTDGSSTPSSALSARTTPLPFQSDNSSSANEDDDGDDDISHLSSAARTSRSAAKASKFFGVDAPPPAGIGAKGTVVSHSAAGSEKSSLARNRRRLSSEPPLPSEDLQQVPVAKSSGGFLSRLGRSKNPQPAGRTRSHIDTISSSSNGNISSVDLSERVKASQSVDSLILPTEASPPSTRSRTLSSVSAISTGSAGSGSGGSTPVATIQPGSPSKQIFHHLRQSSSSNSVDGDSTTEENTDADGGDDDFHASRQRRNSAKVSKFFGEEVADANAAPASPSPASQGRRMSAAAAFDHNTKPRSPTRTLLVTSLMREKNMALENSRRSSEEAAMLSHSRKLSKFFGDMPIPTNAGDDLSSSSSTGMPSTPSTAAGTTPPSPSTPGGTISKGRHGSDERILVLVERGVDDLELKFRNPQTTEVPIVVSGTLQRIVVRVTYALYADTQLESTVLLTYSMFTTPDALLQALIACYQSPFIPPGQRSRTPEELHKTVRLKVLKTLMTWVDRRKLTDDKQLSAYFCNPLNAPVGAVGSIMSLQGSPIAPFAAFETSSQTIVKQIHDFLEEVAHSGAPAELTATAKRIENLLETQYSFSFKPKARGFVEERTAGSAAIPTTPEADSALHRTFHVGGAPDEDDKKRRKTKNVLARTRGIAEQLTLMDFENFSAIGTDELLNKNWSSKPQQAPNITRMIDWFNTVSNWVVESILLTDSHDQRLLIMEDFVQIAAHLKSLNNYNGLLTIMSGLVNAAIIRLKRTWERVAKPIMTVFEDLKRFIDSSGNSKTMREALSAVSPPCVPYLGIYLSDLTFLDDGNPTFVKNEAGDKLINVAKFSHISKILLNVQHFQQNGYSLARNSGTTDLLKSINPTMSVDQCYKQSLKIEPRASTTLKPQQLAASSNEQLDSVSASVTISVSTPSEAAARANSSPMPADQAPPAVLRPRRRSMSDSSVAAVDMDAIVEVAASVAISDHQKSRSVRPVSMLVSSSSSASLMGGDSQGTSVPPKGGRIKKVLTWGRSRGKYKLDEAISEATESHHLSESEDATRKNAPSSRDRPSVSAVFAANPAANVTSALNADAMNTTASSTTISPNALASPPELEEPPISPGRRHTEPPVEAVAPAEAESRKRTISRQDGLRAHVPRRRRTDAAGKNSPSNTSFESQEDLSQSAEAPETVTNAWLDDIQLAIQHLTAKVQGLKQLRRSDVQSQDALERAQLELMHLKLQLKTLQEPSTRAHLLDALRKYRSLNDVSALSDQVEAIQETVSIIRAGLGAPLAFLSSADAKEEPVVVSEGASSGLMGTKALTQSAPIAQSTFSSVFASSFASSFTNATSVSLHSGALRRTTRRGSYSSGQDAIAIALQQKSGNPSQSRRPLSTMALVEDDHDQHGSKDESLA
ncbi:hypothetical protein CAOG_007217 [Capsaspora owczarzaki ATCC 30864]|uniref:Uncharacterized protein n=2 Tax=Capsaspora owczarzaki (strain ATCC 30864) TaxID=595528 RepID=A0A0D2X579_CAPO3|nr:hypothetical protein CAOG_007217 [Capsaspora owczarzaki ATCC 30864]